MPSGGDHGAGQASDQGAAWTALMSKVLKGASIDRLVRRTADGIAINPLYTLHDHAPQPATPGEAPWLRGSRAAGAAAGGWDVRQQVEAHDPVLANRAVLEELERGATSVTLVIAGARPEGGGIEIATARDLDAVLDGIQLDLAPAMLQAGRRGIEVAQLLLDLVAARGHVPGEVALELGLDPIGGYARGDGTDPGATVPAVAGFAAGLSGQPRILPLLADGRIAHAAGGSEAQELAFAITSGIAYLRALEGQGVALSDAAAAIGFAFAVDDDLFLNLAKLRVARRLWWRVLDACGIADAPMRIHAETASRMLTRRDPHVNLLRATVGTFAAACGGADSIAVLPFDHALGEPDGFSRRIARNTQLVLMEESNLHRVIDPAGGSWYVESLTEALAQKAWDLVQEIEGRGGIVTALAAGTLQASIAAVRDARASDIATRRQPITGISEFPDLAAAAITARPRHGAWAGQPAGALRPLRLAAPFEDLRDRSDARLAAKGVRPAIHLAVLGRQAEFGARASWARSLFEAGGIEVRMGEPAATSDEAVASWRQTGVPTAVLCSSDELYASLAAPTAQALKAAGCRRLVMLGRPADEPGLRAAGVDGFIFAGGDVLVLLEGLQEERP